MMTNGLTISSPPISSPAAALDLLAGRHTRRVYAAPPHCRPQLPAFRAAPNSTDSARRWPMAARVPLRVEVRDVLNLHRQGRHDEALQRAVNLAAVERNRCALVMNLAGNLLLEARLRDQGSSPDRAQPPPASRHW